MFELVTTAPLRDDESIASNAEDEDGSCNLRLKGESILPIYTKSVMFKMSKGFRIAES